MKGPLDIERETYIRLKDDIELLRVWSARKLKGKEITDAVIHCDTLILRFIDGTWYAITANEDWFHEDWDLDNYVETLINLGIVLQKDHDEIKANMERCAEKYRNMDERAEYLRLKKIYGPDRNDSPKLKKILGDDK